jgi:hypothetical protein
MGFKMVAVEEKNIRTNLAQNFCFITKSFRFARQEDIILLTTQTTWYKETAVDIIKHQPTVCFKYKMI